MQKKDKDKKINKKWSNYSFFQKTCIILTIIVIFVIIIQIGIIISYHVKISNTKNKDKEIAPSIFIEKSLAK